MSDEPERAVSSRRGLLTVALGGGAALLAGCGTRSLRSRVKRGAKVAPEDVDVLNQLLGLEYHAIAVYTAGIPYLRRSVRKVAKQFLGQEVTHASTLAGLVKQAGGKAIEPNSSYDVGQPRQDEILTLLHQLEGQQLDAYTQLLPSLTGGKLRATAAAIMANDSQHLALLRQAMGERPVPSAFASGRE